MFVVTFINEGYLENTWVCDTYVEALDKVNDMLLEEGIHGHWSRNHFFDEDGLDIYINEPDCDYRENK